MAAFQQLLKTEHIPLEILPGGETRIEPGDTEAEIVAGVHSGELLTLGDQGRYFLMDLPEDVYVPLNRLVAELKSLGITPILAHPERNRGLISRPELLLPLVDAGCRAANGASMLLHQGTRALELWTGQPAPVKVMRAALEKNLYG